MLWRKFKDSSPEFKAGCIFACLFVVSLAIGFCTGELKLPTFRG